jgi:hypothetical protein
MADSSWRKREAEFANDDFGRSIWCAGLSGLTRSSNHTTETDRRDQMHQIPATRREMLPGTFLIPPAAADGRTHRATRMNNAVHRDVTDKIVAAIQRNRIR